jgi:hypothetical protein
MGLSGRIFLLDRNDHLHRLANTKFEQMLCDPTCHRVPRFAGARVRMTDVVVELLDRQPTRVVWTTFAMLTFDGEGYLDPSAFDRHQRALAELALAPLSTEPEGAAPVVDAASRFVAQGGRWVPSKTLARRIEDAALGRVKCSRL